MKRIKVIKKNLITLRDYTLVGPQRGNMVSVIKKKMSRSKHKNYKYGKTTYNHRQTYRPPKGQEE